MAGFAIRHLVPYQVTFSAIDLGSGKHISNIHYLRCGIQGVSPPAYGAPIAGASSTTTALANFQIQWNTTIVPRLNANYSLVQGSMVALLGKRYGTPLTPIVAWVPGAPVIVYTSIPHGFTSGDAISVAGVSVPAGGNGVYSVSVLTPTSFSLDGSNLFNVWSGDGTVQRAQGRLEWLTADLEVNTANTAVGGVVGDAAPLFSTASIRRLNGGIGRRFRSRFSLSPMSEIDILDGGFTTTQKALMVTALSNFLPATQNGGSDAQSKFMIQYAVSKANAFGLPSPFTTNIPWIQPIQSFVQQRNMGSLTRRKPKLTGIIV